ncbi:MAG: hydrolase [Candidatus Paceibacterota bacterium]|jgi:hypothetical protein|nr:hypothetical protein [Candidatus Paceibacterota bacterium]
MDQNNICCVEFHPEKWDGKTLEWKDKLFIKETVPTLFHIPFPPMIGSKITKMSKTAEDAKAMPENKEEVLILFRDPSAFRSELYFSVTKEIPGADNAKISGTFVSKVFDGSYNAIPKFIKEMDAHLASSGKKAKDYYVHYAYCPKCAKKYQHNYVLLFAEV